ncbi:xylose isomerase-like protein [Dactylonectria estremocensis]|uniref:Xylose isomerase-like protein n=1 Tax=Dactylonectria estremocensis TaxID=1079267 RepID=A0A9P9IK81_9HYPO|nr:xylose isomerase-like protein [Dactylonectria estremocensis]
MPAKAIPNELGIATLSLGHCSKHPLEPRIRAAAAAGFDVIDLFDEDWATYLGENGLDSSDPWEASHEKLLVARQLRAFVASLGMRIACTQPLRDIEGNLQPAEREAAMNRVAARFPFMRAFDTDLVFMCSSMRPDDGVTSTANFQTVVRDLTQLSDMALEYAEKDGLGMLRIGYEPLSWARRNTWAAAWEVVRAVDRDNVGIILDSFNILAVEFADPYSRLGEGRMLYSSRDQALRILQDSMAAMAATVRPEKLFFVQVADAERMQPGFNPPSDPTTPKLLPWSRSHRLFPEEQRRGGYMPVEMVLRAILQTGYTGPLSLEVFTHSLHVEGERVPGELAGRGINGLRSLIKKIADRPRVRGDGLRANM